MWFKLIDHIVARHSISTRVVCARLSKPFMQLLGAIIAHNYWMQLLDAIIAHIEAYESMILS